MFTTLSGEPQFQLFRFLNGSCHPEQREGSLHPISPSQGVLTQAVGPPLDFGGITNFGAAGPSRSCRTIRAVRCFSICITADGVPISDSVISKRDAFWQFPQPDVTSDLAFHSSIAQSWSRPRRSKETKSLPVNSLFSRF